MSHHVWQIACGEQGRRYDHLFLNHDVMFLGPGDFGAYAEEHYECNDNFHRTGIKRTEVKRFACEPKPGDTVLLRAGYVVVAIGRIPSGEHEYSWNETFDDVYGWDLQHSRRVRWTHSVAEELAHIQAEQPLFARRRQIPTFTKVDDSQILDPVRQLLIAEDDRPLMALPQTPPRPLKLEQFCDALFARGLSYEAIGRLRRTLEKQRSLLEWYGQSHSSNRPNEMEIVAHVILPLLIALGWSEQLLAIEWHHVDLAMFSGTPTDSERCRMICEAKGMGRGLEDVVHQAQGYCAKRHLVNCKRIIVADGGRFYLYDRSENDWPSQPSGYLNVKRLRTSHLCPEGTNAVETLMKLTPMQS